MASVTIGAQSTLASKTVYHRRTRQGRAERPSDRLQVSWRRRILLLTDVSAVHNNNKFMARNGSGRIGSVEMTYERGRAREKARESAFEMNERMNLLGSSDIRSSFDTQIISINLFVNHSIFDIISLACEVTHRASRSQTGLPISVILSES